MKRKNPFRFLDLPAELRCKVYESIDFSSTWHTLERCCTRMDNYTWPVPPRAAVYDSHIVFIRPYVHIDILLTCKLVHQEAREILQTRAKQCQKAPLRYLGDFSGASALTAQHGVLRGCIGLSRFPVGQLQKTTHDFLRLCRSYIKGLRRVSDGLCTIEITITHKPGATYAREVFVMAMRMQNGYLHKLHHVDSPLRLVFVHRSPLPRVQYGDIQAWVPEGLERYGWDDILQEGDREGPGTFVRVLGKKEFQKHVDGLEWY